MSSVITSSFISGYLLCRLPEVSRVGQPAVEFGQLLQHVGQLGESWPLSQVVSPAGREDLLRWEKHFESVHLAKRWTLHSLDCGLWMMIDRKSFAPSWYLCITRAWRITCHPHTSRTNMCNTCASVSTHSDLLAKADLRQDLLYALSAPHLPDGSFHRLVGDWPVPSLKLIPNGAKRGKGKV